MPLKKNCGASWVSVAWVKMTAPCLFASVAMKICKNMTCEAKQRHSFGKPDNGQTGLNEIIQMCCLSSVSPRFIKHKGKVSNLRILKTINK